jgi:CRP/FNR family cyclic AMP-dependent transcriptional regulator
MQRISETLAKIALFRSLSDSDVAKLDTQCLWRRYSANEWIVSYQDQSNDVFFIVSGLVQVKIQAISGRETLLRDIAAGEYFGELGAIDAKPRSSDIVAVTETTIARMPSGTFRAAVHSHPDLCDQLLCHLASQIRMLANRVNEYSTLDVRTRLYAELLRLARPDRRDDNRALVTPPPPHADLAARISTRRESVSRELKLLERSGLLEKRRGGLILADVARLRRLLEEETEETGQGRLAVARQ